MKNSKLSMNSSSNPDEVVNQQFTEEEWTTFANETQESRTKVVNALNAGEEVQLRDFLKAGLGFADMPQYLQRGETKKNVKDLQESLITCKAFYRPIEVVSVRMFMENNLGTPLRLDGTPISLSDPDVDFLYVRPDGKQRCCAYANLFSYNGYKEREAEYDVRVKLCPSPIKNLPIYVREIQTAAVWDEKTKRKTTVAIFGSSESGLTLMNHFIEESGMTARGAFKLIYYWDGYKKYLYEASVSSGQLHHYLEASPEIIKRAKRNYEAMRIAFRETPKYLKNSAAVDALIKVCVTSPNQNEAVEEFLTFLKTLNDRDFVTLDKLRTLSDKTLRFICMFEKFKEKLATTPSFKDEVAEMVKTAEKEYKMACIRAQEKPKKVKPTHEAPFFQVGAHATSKTEDK